jgi:hypothetical protein
MSVTAINQVLYAVDFVPDLSDEAVIARFADSIINQRNFVQPPEQYAEAIDAVLRDGHLPEQEHPASEFYSEPELLDFLRRLAARIPHRSP